MYKYGNYLLNTIEIKLLSSSWSNSAHVHLLSMVRGLSLLIFKVRDERSRSQWTNMETTLWKTYRPVINLVHVLSMMRKYGSKVRVTMNTYRNKHFESIALNPGDGVYKAENSVFSPVSSLRSWRSHLFVWRLRKPINLVQVCISNDRAVPTPGFKQYNSRPTQTKTTKLTYRSFDNFYFHFLVLLVYASVIYCFRKCLKFLGAIIASVLLNNSMCSFDVRSLLIGVQKKLELQEKGIFLCWHRQKFVQ